MILTNQTCCITFEYIDILLAMILLVDVASVTNCILNYITARDNVALVIHFTITDTYLTICTLLTRYLLTSYTYLSLTDIRERIMLRWYVTDKVECFNFNVSMSCVKLRTYIQNWFLILRAYTLQLKCLSM